jgi:hypothetical protein
VKILGLVGALGEQIEGMLAVSLAHAVLAGAKAMEELLVSPYGPFVALEGGEIADRTGHIRLQMLADRGEGKLTAMEFLEDADTREQSHDAKKRVGLRIHFAGENLNRDRMLTHIVRHPKPRDTRKRKSDLLASHQLENDRA